MSECRRICESLAGYVDDLLRPEERDSVERHLAACPSCRRRADDEERRTAAVAARRIEAAGRAVASRASRDDARRSRGPEEGRSPVRARCGPWWRVRLVPVLLTVVVMIFTASAFFSLATRRSDALLAAQLTADHSKCFKLFGPPDGLSADAGSIERCSPSSTARTCTSLLVCGEDDIQLARCPAMSVRRRASCRMSCIASMAQDMSLFVLAGTERKPDDLVTLGHRSQIWSQRRDDVRARFAGRC